MFRRIVVTGDLLRPYDMGGEGWVSATAPNIRWLWSLIDVAVRDLGYPVTTVAWDPQLPAARNRYFDAPGLYHRLGEELSYDGWSRLASRTLPEAACAAFEEAFDDALVIGYELPDGMIGMLARAGIPFIDISLAAIRFLDDLCFALRTSLPQHHAVLLRHALKHEAIREQAALIRAKAAWMQPPVPQAIPPGSALLLGQVSNDRAMIRPEGGYRSLGDYMERLHRLCCDHPLVMFKPHPYDKPDSPSQQAVGRLPAITTVDANFYHLICQPQVERVVAINSSGLLEASYFGLQADGFERPLYAYGEEGPAGDGRPGQPVPQDGHWTSAAFWRELLHGERGGVATGRVANRLRRSMNADWGYGFIEKVVA